MDDDVLRLAASLRQALDARETAPAMRAGVLADLLAPGVQLRALGRQVEGLAQVLDELLALAAEADAAGMQWLAPTGTEGGAVLVADSPAARPERGHVLTVQGGNGRITQLARQRTAPRPAPPAPLVLPAALRERINRALEERHPMLLSHVDAAGQPVLSFRGSVQVHGDDSLALWVRNPQGGFVAAIAANPRVALMYRNEEARATYQFQGRARVAVTPTGRRAVYDAAPRVERDHDFAMAGVAVVIDLDRVEGYAGLGPGGQVDRICLVRGA